LSDKSRIINILRDLLQLLFGKISLMKSFSILLTLGIALCAMILAACNGSSNDAAAAVESYVQLLAEKDVERISTLACANWEAEAKTELESFTAVSVSVDNLTCQDSGMDGDFTLVSCSGTIIANYGNEVQEIDLSERTYQAVYEAGEWRMCGYR
jgi:hypothetical protein